MEDLLHDAARRAARYLDGLPERRVFPTAEAIASLKQLGGPLPDEPMPPEAVLALLDEAGTPAAVASAGGRYFGFVTGAALPAALAANWLAGAWDQNAFSEVSSPVGATVEDIALDWLKDALGLPASCGAAIVTGATMANFTALAAARRTLLEKAGWDVEADGLFGAPPLTVVVGEEVHPTVLKALGLLGLGRSRVVAVPADHQGRLRADQLPPLTPQTIVCVQAGNVNTGAFDPIADVCVQARDAGSWVHVDGAFGLWAAAAPHRRRLTDGLADADSWAADAHKWLNVPYDCGLAFVRDPLALPAVLSMRAPYLLVGQARAPFDYTPESSRRARGVDVWAALRSLGRSGLADLIERCCRHATRFAEGFRSAGYDVLNDVVLNQVLVSFGPPEVTRRVVRAVQEGGTCWVAGTVWQGRTAMRISVSSWATTDDDVERSLRAMLRAAARERAAQPF